MEVSTFISLSHAMASQWHAKGGIANGWIDPPKQCIQHSTQQMLCGEMLHKVLYAIQGAVCCTRCCMLYKVLYAVQGAVCCTRCCIAQHDITDTGQTSCHWLIAIGVMSLIMMYMSPLYTCSMHTWWLVVTSYIYTSYIDDCMICKNEETFINYDNWQFSQNIYCRETVAEAFI